MALTANFPDIVAGLGINGFVGGDRARSADVNSYVLEPLLWTKALMGAQSNVVTVADLDGTVMTLTSTSYVDVTGASLSIVVREQSKILVDGFIQFQGTGSVTSFTATALIGATDLGNATYGLLYQTGNVQGARPFAAPLSSALTAGTYTVKLQAKIVLGAGTNYLINQFVLRAQEVPAT